MTSLLSRSGCQIGKCLILYLYVQPYMNRHLSVSQQQSGNAVEADEKFSRGSISWQTILFPTIWHLEGK